MIIDNTLLGGKVKTKLISMILINFSIASYSSISAAQEGYPGNNAPNFQSQTITESVGTPSNNYPGNNAPNYQSQTITESVGTPSNNYPGNNAPNYQSQTITESVGTPPNNYPDSSSQKPHHKHKKKDALSIALNLLAPQETIVVEEHHHYVGASYPGLQWISSKSGRILPHHAVVGGDQANPPATLYVCHANYRGGVHPGKLYDGRCNISWGGKEIVMNRYEVLSSRAPLSWVSASYGKIPAGAIQGGYQHDGPLFICQAEYQNGLHIGKVYGENCNFGWGGKEIYLPYYNVLVG
jgi:hypothetical protein